MPITLYDFTAAMFDRGLERLAAVLDKGRAHADAAGTPHDALLGARLAPDMLTLVGQVQRASDTAKLTLVRVGGVENEPFPDEEAGFGDLAARIARTRAFIARVPRAAIDGREDAIVSASVGRIAVSMPAGEYVRAFALPNFQFHVVTAYDILRAKGVDLGKRDFIGPLG